MRHCFCLVPLVLIGVTGCSHRLSSPPPTTGQSLPVWTSNAALSSHLAAPYKIGSYSIRPPQGYTAHPSKMQTESGRSILCNWTGPTRPDGTKPILEVMVVDDSGRISSHLRPSTGVRMIMLGYSSEYPQLVRSHVENGMLNGKPFSRAYWNGRGAKTKILSHGAVYLSIAPPEIIKITGKDADPYQKDTLALCEASALTFRRL